jgi:hypothetical protein
MSQQSYPCENDDGKACGDDKISGFQVALV